MYAQEATVPNIVHSVSGRALLADKGGSLYIARGYSIFRSNDGGENWELVTTLPRSPLRRVSEPFRLACRLLRHEVRSFAKLSGDAYIAATRQGLFFGSSGDSEMRCARVHAAGRVPAPPMQIEVGADETIVWGEYSSQRTNEKVGIFASEDKGQNYELVYELPPLSVRHIHNIRLDSLREHYWILTGDYGDEPGIGMLSKDFSRFEWLVRGAQRYRAADVFDLGESLLFATDTDREPNRFVKVDKNTGMYEEFGELPGSCIYASRFGSGYVISTSVEPSKVNQSKMATLWISGDGRDWTKYLQVRKDRWHHKYFQFGSLVLPAGATSEGVLFFSGQAVEGIDGTTLIAHLSEEDCSQRQLGAISIS